MIPDYIIQYTNVLILNNIKIENRRPRRTKARLDGVSLLYAGFHCSYLASVAHAAALLLANLFN